MAMVEGYVFMPPRKRLDGKLTRIDKVTGLSAEVRKNTGIPDGTACYKIVCPRCGKPIRNEDMSKSWSYRVGAAEKYVHRCTDTDCADISTLLVPVPKGMTIHGLYKCVRYGLQHKAEAMAEEDPVPPEQKGGEMG